jgi:Cof subfamily protein (haloacid dehalogenase superfamily)
MPHTQPFDLVIIDLDGTIIDPYESGEISPRVVEIVAAVQAAGVPVTIATGRTLEYVRAHLGGLDVTLPIVTAQGAILGDPVTGEVLDETVLPLSPARRLLRWIDARNPVSAVYFSNGDGSIRIVQNRSGDRRNFEHYALGVPAAMQPTLADLLAADDAHLPIKIMLLNDASAEPNLAPAIKAAFEPELSITRTHPFLVEATASGVDKGQGVRKLCARLRVDPARVLAIGDSDNDIPMLEAVGFAVAMGNASDGVLRVSDWVAPSVDEDGAAVALEKWVLERQG